MADDEQLCLLGLGPRLQPSSFPLALF
jgi:hypothetical protein